MKLSKTGDKFMTAAIDAGIRAASTYSHFPSKKHIFNYYEPKFTMNVDSFVNVVTYYAFSAAELTRTETRVNRKQWNCGGDLLYTLLKPVNTINTA